MKYTFPSVKHTEKRRGMCARCRKVCIRSKTFEHTVNPFNKHPDGTVKTHQEVQADVRAEGIAWAKTPLVCKGCEG